MSLSRWLQSTRHLMLRDDRDGVPRIAAMICAAPDGIRDGMASGNLESADIGRQVMPQAAVRLSVFQGSPLPTSFSPQAIEQHPAGIGCELSVITSTVFRSSTVSPKSPNGRGHYGQRLVVQSKQPKVMTYPDQGSRPCSPRTSRTTRAYTLPESI